MEQQLIEFLTLLNRSIPDSNPIMEGSRQRAERRQAKAEYPAKMAAFTQQAPGAQNDLGAARPELPSSGSQAARQMGKVPGENKGGPYMMRQLIKTLHTRYGMSHNQEFVPAHRVLFGELKEFPQGAWSLIAGSNGCAATKWDGNTHQVVVSSDGGIETWENQRGGNIEAFIKQRIGKMLKFYLAADNRYAKKKRSDRAKAAAANSKGPDVVTLDSLVMRLKPLWMRYISIAEADIGGMIKTMISAGAYTRASNKLQYLSKIDKVLKKMEAGDFQGRSNSYSHDSVVDFVGNALKGALAMTAHQFYPDLTGEITRNNAGEYSVGSHGVQQILTDISNGDLSKIAVTMRHFKRTLL